MRVGLIVVLLAACGGRVPPPRLAPGVEKAAWFAGTWQGRSRAASGKETTLHWAVTPSLGGTWLEGRARAVELGLEARDFIGPAGTGYIRVYLDSQGTRVAMLSPGWEGKTLRWEGAIHAPDGTDIKVREAVDRVDDDTLHAVWEIWNEGAWAPMSEETLHRVK